MSREITKGAPRRIFKPTIPTTRRSTQRAATGVTGGCNGVNGGVNGGWEACDQNNSCNSKVKGKQKSNKPRGKKEFIQLDATFNGINKVPSAVKAEKAFINPGVSGFGHSNDTRSSQSDSPRGFGSTGDGGGSGLINGLSVKVKSDDGPSCYGNNYKTNNLVDHHHHGKEVIKQGEEAEEDVESIQRALYRDDFVSLYDPNDKDMTPIGWKCVSQHQVFKQEKNKIKSTTIRFDKWACTEKEKDKMVLFQLPEMLLNSGDGHVGKVRMYKSGKMELIDTRTGVVHDLLHTDCQVNPDPCGEDEDDDDDEDDSETDKNSDEDKNSEENGEDEFKELSGNGKSKFSTDWIKKEVEDDNVNNRNYDSQPSTTFSKPSTSSYLSMQSPSSSKLNHLSSSSKSKPSKSSSKNLKANNYKLNRRNNCDKDEESDDDDDDDDETYREACTFDGEKVVCLGPISNNQLLIGRPRLDKFINL